MEGDAPRSPASVAATLRQGLAALEVLDPLAKAAVAVLFALFVSFLPLGGASLWAPLSVDGTQFRDKPGIDGFALHAAGWRLRHGHNPYAAAAPTGSAPYATAFRYLPHAALVHGTLLSLLPPFAAMGLVVALGFAGVCAGYLHLVGQSPHRAVPLALVCFGCFPVVPDWHLGQYNLLVGAGILWTLILLRRGAETAAALVWVTVAAIKVFPFAFALPMVLERRWRAPALAAAFLVAGAALWLALAPAPASVAGGMTRETFSLSPRQPYAGAQGAQEAVNALWWRAKGLAFGQTTDAATGGRTYAAAVALLALASAGWFGWLLLQCRRTGDHHPLALAITLLWFVAFRDAWEHHYAMLLPVLALAAASPRSPVWAVVLCWLGIGAPSLWYAWNAAGYSGTALAEALGLGYFLQRPLLGLLPLAVLVSRLAVSAPAAAGLPASGSSLPPQ